MCIYIEWIQRVFTALRGLHMCIYIEWIQRAFATLKRVIRVKRNPYILWLTYYSHFTIQNFIGANKFMKGYKLLNLK